MSELMISDEAPPSPPRSMFGQRVVKAVPPNYHQILDHFPHVRSRRGVIFSYGDIVYSPDTDTIPPYLVAHEAVHGERQIAIGVKAWWDRYCIDKQFRFDEEWPAHVAELRWFQSSHRSLRRSALNEIAARLAGPLYGNLMRKDEVKRLLKQELTSLGEQTRS